MLTSAIERLLIFLTNHFVSSQLFTHKAAGAQRVQPHRSSTGGLLSRLLRRSSPAAVPALPADPPVVIGTMIPSAREALRQSAGRQGSGVAMAVSLSTEVRSKHLLIIGKSGMGKTNFNVGLIDSDFAAGRAVVLLDYRGDLVDRVCQRLAAKYSPADMADRLLVLDLRSPPGDADPAASAFTVGFNPLSQCGRTPYARGLFTYDLFQQHFGAALGVQTSETLQNCLLVLALTGKTLLDIEPLLSSETFRAQTLARVEDSSILRFFARLEALPEAQRALWVNPIQNKLAPFLINPVLRATLGSSQSVSIQDFLDRRPDGIILFCAGADEHYGSTAVMLSNLVVHAVAAAIMRTDRRSRHSVMLYADEFQNLSGDKFSEIISEGRRFGLWLTLSHQSPSQLEPKIRTLVRNVVSTSLIFGVGGIDSETLANEVASEEPKTVVRNLLINQKPGEAMLLRQGMPAARIRTLLSPDPDVAKEAVWEMRLASLRQQGRPTSEVEAELRAREALFMPPLSSTHKSAPSFGQSAAATSIAAKNGVSKRKRAAPATASSTGSHDEVVTSEKRNFTENYEVRDHDD